MTSLRIAFNELLHVCIDLVDSRDVGGASLFIVTVSTLSQSGLES